MVISSKDFEWVEGTLVRSKKSNQEGPLYERSRPPYDGVARRIARYSCAEWNPIIKQMDPIIFFSGISKGVPLSDFEVVNEA